MATTCLLVTQSSSWGVHDLRDCSVADSSTCLHFFVSTSCLPFGDGTVGLPGNHLIDADLRGHIDRLFVMAGLARACTIASLVTGLRLLAESQHFRDSLLRVAQYGVDAQSPAVGKLQFVAVLNRMPGWRAAYGEGSVSLHPA